jgi:hypothetical protein
MEDCIKGVNECFSNKITLSVYYEADGINMAQHGHVKDHNLYLIMINFISRMRFQNQAFTKKIRKKLKIPMSQDFEGFKMKEFYIWLNDLGQYKMGKENPSNNPNEANIPGKGQNPRNSKHRLSNEEWQEKLDKAKKGNYCVKCASKECLTFKKSEGKKKNLNWTKIKCIKKVKVNTNEEETTDDPPEETDDANQSMNYVATFPEGHFGQPLTYRSGLPFQSTNWVIQQGCPYTYDTDDEDDEEVEQVDPEVAKIIAREEHLNETLDTVNALLVG